ncbi:MAG: choice-of-anchor D domain-containing protein [Caldimonas sp.]
MNIVALRVGAARAILAASLLVAVTGASAQNWVNGKAQYNTICTNCHNSNTTLSLGAFPATATLGSSASYLQGRFNEGAAVGSQMGSPHTDGLRTADGGNSPINATVADIAAYIGNPDFPTASLSPASYSFGSLAVTATDTRTFTLTNNGTGSPLLVTSAVLSDTTNYTITANNCVSVAAGGGTCSITVQFRPQSVATFNARTLTISHNALGGTSTGTLNGTGIVPFSVSATALDFTPVTAPGGVLATIVTDNKGDRIRICRAAAATFSFPNDFSLDPPFTLDGSGCFTSTTGAPGRTLTLNVRFGAGAPGPRNGVLTIQRVDAVGVGLGGVVQVQLQGNPGPLATVNASSLFDDPADPGVEVDNDNTLDRTVTLFSQGSAPLVFAGSTFTIAGPNAAEYTLLNTGCRALAGLADGTGSPQPSCALTVRFNPSGIGRRGPAILTIAVAGAPTRTVLLNGLGILGPRLAVSNAGGPLASGASLNFGAQTIGGLYPPRLLTLTNGGTLGNLEVAMPAAGSIPGYTLTADAACALLVPAASCSVALAFAPSATQAYPATLVFRSRPAGSVAAYDNFSLALAGDGTASAVPKLVWTDATGTPITTFGFGNANVGTPASGSVRLRNDGPGGVTMSLVNAVGVAAAQFVLDSSACAAGTPVFEGTSCAVGLLFAPGSAGAKTATLQAVSSAGSPAVSVLAPDFTLTGTGVGGTTTASLLASSNALAFSATAGAKSLPLELVVTNGGTTPVQITGYDISAGWTVDAKTCPQAPFSLAAGAECALSLTYAPQSPGSSQGQLSVHIEGQATTLDVALSGSAAPQADVSSGGCTIGDGNARTDPALWLLVLLAGGVLWWRRRGERRRLLRAGIPTKRQQR